MDDTMVEFLAQVQEEIERTRRQRVICVEADETPWAYTVGLSKLAGHPELLIVGLSATVAGAILNTIADRIRNGLVLRVDDRLGQVVANFDVLIGAPLNTSCDITHDMVGWPGVALALGERSINVMQVFWPDEQGRFTGEPGHNTKWADYQRLRQL